MNLDNGFLQFYDDTVVLTVVDKATNRVVMRFLGPIFNFIGMSDSDFRLHTGPVQTFRMIQGGSEIFNATVGVRGYIDDLRG